MTLDIDHERTVERRSARPKGGHAGERDGRYRPRWMPRLNSTRILVDLFIVMEAGAVYFSGLLLAAAYVGGRLGVADYHSDYLPVISLLLLVLILLAKSRRLYEFESLDAFSTSIGRMIGCVLLAFALVVVIGFALGIADDYSRIWLGLWLTASILSVLLLRAAVASFLRRGARTGLIQLNAAIYGDARTAERLSAEIRRVKPEISLMGVFTTPASGTAGSSSAADPLDQLVAFGLENDLDLVIVAGEAVGRSGLSKTLAALSVLPAEVRVHLNFGEDIVPVRGLSSFDGLHFLDVQRRPISDWNVLLKSIEDYVLAGTAALLLLPLFLVIAVAIKLESAGPVIFRQHRHGLNQKVFTVWKFRTMRVMEDGANFRQATRGDERVTRVGRFLRSTSLDELPQLLNVLKGEMSIVGPRPHPLSMNGQYTTLLNSYGKRHKVKPGITGWAQINGFRGPTQDPALMEKRVEYDVEYIEKWSIWMDLKIIAATPFVALIHENAV